jgi:hypothetical protein
MLFRARHPGAGGNGLAFATSATLREAVTRRNAALIVTYIT